MSDRYKGAILSPTAPTVTPQSAGGIYTSSQQLQYQGQGVWPTAFNNPINNSLRFRSSVSAYLNRTPASATNRRTWTWSGWVKRGVLTGDYPPLFNAGQSAPDTVLRFLNDDTIGAALENGGGGNSRLITTAVYRDPSAWYHIVWAVDTTQATADNRSRLYVNGVEITAFGTRVNPSQNLDTNVNNTVQHRIGGQRYPSYFDGYMAEVNFIDGTQLTPSSFGTTDAYGIWQPIPYTGAYGTNGFYLPFTDNSALTTSSNAGLGKDFSGNGNYWVTNNISITAGSTYDSMKDVPTNTNSNTANYCVMNPLMKFGSNLTWTNGNLQVNKTSSSTTDHTYGTTGVSSGKWYWEMTVTALAGPGNDYIYFGVARGLNLTTSYDETGIWYATDGTKENRASGNSGAYGATWLAGDTVSAALDLDAGTITFYKNGVSQGVAYSNLGSYPGLYMPYVGFDGASVTATTEWNFGQRPFAYTPPSGFYPLNTYNLPTPTILDGDQYFNATLYTGNNSTQAVTGVGFQPDFVWIKERDAVEDHFLFDALRGATNFLRSNTTDAQGTLANYLTAFNSDGFSLGNGGGVNGASDLYVSWNWRASNAAGVSNTQGTITSTVSANTTAGFSIATFTSPSSGTCSFGHGLGVTPAFVIVKSRASGNWICEHTSTGTQYLLLNGTGAATTDSTVFNSAPTSSVVNLGTGFAGSVNYVAYCFAQVAGYSAFGSYTGNGSTDGPFVFTGFRPRFVMIKSSSNAGLNWFIIDSSRNTYNVCDARLFPNSSDAETTGQTNLDITSNGFKVRTDQTSTNGNGYTYIYMAFAESPFKISRAR